MSDTTVDELVIGMVTYQVKSISDFFQIFVTQAPIRQGKRRFHFIFVFIFQ